MPFDRTGADTQRRRACTEHARSSISVAGGVNHVTQGGGLSYRACFVFFTQHFFSSSPLFVTPPPSLTVDQ